MLNYWLEMKKYLVSVDLEIEAESEEQATSVVEEMLEDNNPDVIQVEESTPEA